MSACGSEWNCDLCYLISVVRQLVSFWKVEVCSQLKCCIQSVCSFCCYSLCSHYFSICSFKCYMENCFSELCCFLDRNLHVVIFIDCKIVLSCKFPTSRYIFFHVFYVYLLVFFTYFDHCIADVLIVFYVEVDQVYFFCINLCSYRNFYVSVFIDCKVVLSCKYPTTWYIFFHVLYMYVSIFCSNCDYFITDVFIIFYVEVDQMYVFCLCFCFSNNDMHKTIVFDCISVTCYNQFVSLWFVLICNFYMYFCICCPYCNRYICNVFSCFKSIDQIDFFCLCCDCFYCNVYISVSDHAVCSFEVISCWKMSC